MTRASKLILRERTSRKKQPHDKEEDKSLDKSLVTQEGKKETYSPPLANSTIVSGLEEETIVAGVKKFLTMKVI